MGHSSFSKFDFIGQDEGLCDLIPLEIHSLHKTFNSEEAEEMNVPWFYKNNLPPGKLLRFLLS